MMITKIGEALAVIAALALLAMPAHALAQEGESHHEGKQRQGKGANGDEWYQGKRGHWYKEGNRWQWRGDVGDRD